MRGKHGFGCAPRLLRGQCWWIKLRFGLKGTWPPWMQIQGLGRRVLVCRDVQYPVSHFKPAVTHTKLCEIQYHWRENAAAATEPCSVCFPSVGHTGQVLMKLLFKQFEHPGGSVTRSVASQHEGAASSWVRMGL